MTTRVKVDDIVECLRVKEQRIILSEDGWIQGDFRGYFTEMKTVVGLNLDKDFIVIFAKYPQTVPENKRINVSELILRINNMLYTECCLMTMPIGILEWKSWVLVADADFQSNQFIDAYFNCLQAADFWHTAFMSVIYGDRNPEQTINEMLEKCKSRRQEVQ